MPEASLGGDGFRLFSNSLYQRDGLPVCILHDRLTLSSLFPYRGKGGCVSAGLLRTVDGRDRFVQRTDLTANERNINFRMLDNDVIETITSPEAFSVSGYIAAIYLKLKNAPPIHLEKNGVLYFRGDGEEGGGHTPWQQLCKYLGVSSATARKSLEWLREQKVIGYWASRCGYGIRIFLNRAVSSLRSTCGTGMPEVVTSTCPPPTSFSKAPFKDNLRINSRDFISLVDTSEQTEKSPETTNAVVTLSSTNSPAQRSESSISHIVNETISARLAHSLPNLLDLTSSEVERRLTPVFASMCASEFTNIKVWLDDKGLPKLARVAQRETFKILEKTQYQQSERERLRHELAVGSPISVSVNLPPAASARSEPITSRRCTTDSEADGLWADVRNRLALTIPQEAIRAWIEPLKAVKIYKQTLVLQAESDVVVDWVHLQLLSSIENEVVSLRDATWSVKLEPSGTGNSEQVTVGV